MSDNKPVQNTDREIWRAGDCYSPSIFVTRLGSIGINCGGHAIVASVQQWHKCGEFILCVDPTLPRWRYRLALWLLRWNKRLCLRSRLNPRGV